MKLFGNPRSERLRGFPQRDGSLTTTKKTNRGGREIHSMKKLVLTLAALAIGGRQRPSRRTSVRMGSEGAYPPYNFIK